jgi:hypothetical protein
MKSWLPDKKINPLFGKEVVIGHPDDESEESTISIPYSVREAHMQVIGRTRSGKSRFLADLIRQDIVNGVGLCLLDPHGELYDFTMNWLAQEKLVQRIQPNIHPIKLTDPNTTFRYNPLHIDRPEDAYIVASNVVEAITRIYGGKDSSETPLFSFILDIICTILALRGLPLAAATQFIFNGELDREIREHILEGVSDPYYKNLGQSLSQMSPKEFRETVGSTGRRLHEFLGNPAVRRIFSTTENTLPLKEIMDGSHVLLIDASKQGDGGLLKKKELRTIGSLLVNNIFASAEKRDPRSKPPPFMLYIDEVQNYINNDIEDILSQAAKRGLFLTLAHQTIAQLVEAGELVYNGVISGTLVKAVFRISEKCADVLVDELFADQVDFTRVKEELASPHVVDHEIAHLKSSGHSEITGFGESKSFGESEGSGFSSSETSAISEMTHLDDSYLSASPHLEAANSGSSQSVISSSSFSSSESFSKSTAFGKTESVGETLKPIFQWFSTQTYTLEEQRYALKRQLFFQAARHGYIAVSGEGSKGFTTRNIADMAHIPTVEAELFQKLTTNSPWISTGEDLPKALTAESLKTSLGIEEGDGFKPEPDGYFEPV